MARPRCKGCEQIRDMRKIISELQKRLARESCLGRSCRYRKAFDMHERLAEICARAEETYRKQEEERIRRNVRKIRLNGKAHGAEYTAVSKGDQVAEARGEGAGEVPVLR